MKNIYLFLLLCLPILGQAQLTITQENSPQIGDKLVYQINTTTSGLSPGDSGQNQVWDFSSFMLQTIETIDVLDPTNVQFQDSFPDANLVLSARNGLTFTFGLTTDSAFFSLGSFIGTGDTATSLLTILNPARKEIQYPTSFGTSFETKISNVRSLGEISPGTSFISIEEETILSQADGEGILKLPQGDFEVIRIQIINNKVDSSFLVTDAGRQFINSTLTQTTSYEWHAAEARGPLMTLDMSGLGTNTSIVSILDLEESRLGDTSEVVVVAPIANFDTIALGQGLYFFLDQSQNEPSVWNWDFGDGTTSFMQNVQHEYEQAGTYQACLTISNTAGSDSICKTITIERLKPLVQFNYTQLEAGNVQFQNLTEGSVDAYFWDFGDGNNSSVTSPDYQYTSEGNFTVCLTAFNEFGSDSTCQNLTIDNILPKADFTFSNTGPGFFEFTNISSNNTDSLSWDFGDGNTSQDINPVYQYSEEGTFTVCLIAINALGSDTTCTTINVNNIFPQANFTLEEQSPGLYSFTDNSSNNTENWFWDFGDGNNSMDQSPDHQYTREGSYTTCLIVDNTFGSDTTCQNLTVSGLRTSAGFDIDQIGQGLFRFDNLSSTNSTQFSWDFGDGAQAQGRAPEHQYTQEGFYTVCLIAANEFYSDTICTSLEVTNLIPQAGFVVLDNIADSIQLMDSSNNFPNAWLWTFGDSTTSDLQSPGHKYTEPGNYQVCLTAINDFGQDTTCQRLDIIFTNTASSLIAQGLTIMPNPFQNQLQINWEPPTSAINWQYNIKDAAGRIIQQGQLLPSNLLETTRWQSGLYWLQIISTDHRSQFTTPIIKQ